MRGSSPPWATCSDPVTDAGIDASFDASGLSRPLPTPVATLFYRAAREALRNVVAHSRASKVEITAGSDAEQGWLRVADDGVGFEPATAEARGRRGSHRPAHARRAGP